MAAAASGPNTEILQFDWLISGQIFPVLPGGDLPKTFVEQKLKISIIYVN